MPETPSSLHPAYFQVRFRTAGPMPRWPERFAILTAYATTGEHWTEARNREADDRLHKELLERGLKPIRITGCDPATGHAVPGWTVEVPLDEALLVGRSYLQDAIFWVEEGHFHVVSCRPGHDCGVLGMFAVQAA